MLFLHWVGGGGRSGQPWGEGCFKLLAGSGFVLFLAAQARPILAALVRPILAAQAAATNLKIFTTDSILKML